jgi:hypothetical protein
MPHLDRRAILKLAGGSIGFALVGTRALHAGEPSGSPLYASCVKTPDDRFAVAVMDDTGRIKRLHPLPGRGHDVAFDPASRRCVAFARRPGTFAVVFDADGRAEPRVISAAPGRHFYGHGVFTAGGGLLYTTENDYGSGQGVIGIYDTRAGFERIGEFPAGGVGSHELVWCGDGATLAIANGGLDTTPEVGGRTNLNRADMKASLSFVDPQAQRVLTTQSLGAAYGGLSIRHLAVDRTGSVWFGCQHLGDPADLPPLAGRVVLGRDPDLFGLPAEIAPLAKNYVGSVAASADGAAIAFSAPKGGLIFAFEAGSGQFLGDIRFDDGCGLSPAESGSRFLATSGSGEVVSVEGSNGVAASLLGRADLAFDNHVSRLV